MAVTWKKLAYEVDVVLKSLFGANQIIAANTSSTPAAITIAEQQVVGRITGGNIKGLSVSELQTLINVEAGADVTDAVNVAAAGAVMESDFTGKGNMIIGTGTHTAAELAHGTNGDVLTLDSAQTTGVKWATPATASGDFKADGTVAMTADLNFAGHAAKDMKIHTVADNTAKLALTPVVGKMAFQTDELAVYVCTASA